MYETRSSIGQAIIIVDERETEAQGGQFDPDIQVDASSADRCTDVCARYRGDARGRAIARGVLQGQDHYDPARASARRLVRSVRTPCRRSHAAIHPGQSQHHRPASSRRRRRGCCADVLRAGRARRHYDGPVHRDHRPHADPAARDRTTDLPNVPLMQELVDDSKTKKIIEFISSGSAIGRALITPPGVPADRLAALREGFDKVVKDPEFIADAAKRSADLEPTPGGTVQTYSDGIASAPRDVIEAATRAIAAEKADKK